MTASTHLHRRAAYHFHKAHVVEVDGICGTGDLAKATRAFAATCLLTVNKVTWTLLPSLSIHVSQSVFFERDSVLQSSLTLLCWSLLPPS